MALLGLPLPGNQQLGYKHLAYVVAHVVFSLLASALLLLRSGVMATSITLLERRREGGHGLCLSPPGKWMSVGQSIDGNGKGVPMAHGFPLLEGRWEGGHGLWPSSLVEWVSVAMVTPIPHFQNEGRKVAMPSPILL